MSIPAITTTATNPNVPHTTTRGFGDMKSEDFFGLLITQLKSQDPMKPMDNQQLLEQMSTIRQMEVSSSLNQTLTEVANEQRTGGSSALIGKFVAGRVTNTAGQATELQGVVVGVSFEPDGKAILELHNGQQIPADKLEQVTLVDNLPPALRDQIRREMAAIGGGPSSGGSSRSLKAAGVATARPVGGLVLNPRLTDLAVNPQALQ